MRVLVCVKQALDVRVALRPDGEGRRVDQDEPERIALLNPADRCALEEAMRWKALYGGEVVALTLGSQEAEAVLRECLGRGADRAVHLVIPAGAALDLLAVARQIAEEARRGSYDLVLCGEKSIDEGSAALGPMLAELLDLPQVTRAVTLDVDPAQRRLVAERLLERGDRVRVACPLPALVSVTAQINEPRYVSLHNQKHAPMGRIERREVGMGEPSMYRVEVGLPKPRPRKVAQPAAALSAADRMSFLFSGGKTQKVKKESGIFEGDPDAAAERIVRFLEEKGLV